jgi:hypothetical protein
MSPEAYLHLVQGEEVQELHVVALLKTLEIHGT